VRDDWSVDEALLPKSAAAALNMKEELMQFKQLVEDDPMRRTGLIGMFCVVGKATEEEIDVVKWKRSR
jgi:hypothetical protein